MNEVVMLRGAEPREILQTAIEKRIPAIMSYLSNGKWHVAKILPTSLGATKLDVHILPIKKPHPINIQVAQPVGISLKHGYGKFIFETKVVALGPSPDATSGGTVVLAVPDCIEIVQRRSYFRVNVPKSLKVNVLLWHRSRRASKAIHNSQYPIGNCWQGELVDISAGGAQVAVDAGQKPDFRKGQFIGFTFTPLPYEKLLMFNAQIRNILPTADGRSICLGVQIVGLEASPQGRQVLSRLVGIVEQYYQINQSGYGWALRPDESSAKQQDMHPAPIEAQPRRCKPGA